ncbi:NifB/NifX family molybdenum-iron cluster-binding protein [Treponema sp.]|uniref:NifB/NifX family molybdenum-iron cluster-binding protein n=1 Tax=Treponema sp. TaxID=166 RepID=UPI00298E9B4A|nr:NifB/NifX family molybdenum-iron cluster-binding protein [Treponema sp.]
MSYKIAVASSDGLIVDGHFGSTDAFEIYEITDEGFSKTESRTIEVPSDEEKTEVRADSRCGCGCAGFIPYKVAALKDCKAVLCARIGPGAKQQLERSGITAFDVVCKIDEALEKISEFYKKSKL